jgi:hypothetical protein
MGQACARVLHAAAGAVRAPPEGAHDPPVGSGAATVTAKASAKTGLHDDETVAVCGVAGFVHCVSSKIDSTGVAQVTPVAVPQLQFEQVAAGATRSPCPLKRLDASASHDGAATAPT